MKQAAAKIKKGVVGSPGITTPIAPNPTNRMVNIQLAGNSDYNINVTNILGEQVYNSIIKGSTSHGIDLSSFDKGIYTIELSNSTEIYIEKIILE